jgi:hypothetical protein
MKVKVKLIAEKSSSRKLWSIQFTLITEDLSVVHVEKEPYLYSYQNWMNLLNRENESFHFISHEKNDFIIYIEKDEENTTEMSFTSKTLITNLKNLIREAKSRGFYFEE